LQLNDGATLNIASGSTFDIQGSPGGLQHFGSPAAINNAGTFQRSVQSSTVTVPSGLVFSNTGTVQSLSGTLSFAGGYTQTAGVTRLNGGSITSSTTMNIQGGTLESTGTLTASVNNTGGSVGPPVNGAFVKPAKHIARLWQLTNAYGSITVLSKKAKALLLPTAADPMILPPAPADAQHYTCYQIKATADVTAQTPDNGSGIGKFRKDLQVFLTDPFFDDCALLADGVTPSFDGTAVEGACLLDLKKPVELCNPVDKTAVVPPRVTAAVIDGSMAGSTKSLLCYKVGLATKFKYGPAATLGSSTLGAAIDPKQAKHVKRGLATGNPVRTTAGNQFPWPTMLNTSKHNLACIPTDIIGVTVAP
jgi:hypothetical protein